MLSDQLRWESAFQKSFHDGQKSNESIVAAPKLSRPLYSKILDQKKYLSTLIWLKEQLLVIAEADPVHVITTTVVSDIIRGVFRVRRGT